MSNALETEPKMNLNDLKPDPNASVEDLKSAVHELFESDRDALQRAFKIGFYLIAIKDKVGRGDFRTWKQKEFPNNGDSTLSLYKRLAENYELVKDCPSIRQARETIQNAESNTEMEGNDSEEESDARGESSEDVEHNETESSFDDSDQSDDQDSTNEEATEPLTLDVPPESIDGLELFQQKRNLRSINEAFVEMVNFVKEHAK